MGSSLSSSLEKIPPSRGQNGAPIDVSQELRDLEAGHVFVEKVSWRRAPMAEKKRFYHDYVLIEVNKINLANNVVDRSVGWIKAEKTYDNDGRGQIPITKLTRLDPVKGLVTKHEVSVGGCPSILMSELLAILGEPRSDYSVMNDNCWKYADVVYRKLLKKFAELPDTQRHIREDLLDKLKAVPKHYSPFDPKRLFRSAYVIRAIATSGVVICIVLPSLFLAVGLGSGLLVLVGSGILTDPVASLFALYVLKWIFVEVGTTLAIGAVILGAPPLSELIKATRDGFVHRRRSKSLRSALITRCYRKWMKSTETRRQRGVSRGRRVEL